MKQENNNEMDLLLRRLGRRDDATMSNAAGDHLDVDEFSAYAENALPTAARARYTAHLAECSQCRGLVVQLSASAGVAAPTDTASVAEPSGLRKFLASLFTPLVLRYAVPALGLIVVAVIGFVVQRRNEPAKYVTQVTDNEQPAAARTVVAPTSQPVYSPAKDTASREGLVDKQAKNQPAGAAPAPNAAPVVTTTQSEVSKDAEAQSKPEQQPASANEAPPPPKAAAPTPTPEESPRTADTVSKREVRELPATAPAAGRAVRRETEREDKDNFARARKSKDERSAAPSTGAASVEGFQSDGLQSSANTRTVAGRRFRKQGGVWIDTAYDSSRDTVTLSRGSEQFRALIADEPAIKTIADELNGEFIVVWKGHTYRIR